VVLSDVDLKRGQRTSLLWCILIGIVTLRIGAGLEVRAAEQPGWTLAQCLTYALEHSGDIQAAAVDIRIAESQLAQAKAGRFPSVTFTSINGIVNAARGDAVDGHTDDDDLGPFSKNDVEIVQPLYTFGRLREEILAATSGVAVKRAATDQTRATVIASVKELYYNLQFSRQIKDLLDEVRENFTMALTTAEARLNAGEGTITQADILKLRIGLAGVSREVLSLTRGIAVARSALKRQIGLAMEADFDIVADPLEPVTVNLQPLAAYLQQAGVRRPEIAQVEAGLEARRARLAAARSAYYPAFFLAGSIRQAEAPNRDDQNNPFVRDDFNYFNAGVAVGVRWQLDFWMTHAKVAERLAELSKVEIQKQQALSGIALDMQQRYLEVEETQQQIVEAQTARKAARGLLVTTLANFKLGIGEGKEVFESLGLYARIVGDYYTVIRNYNIAAARLSQAVGQEVTTLSYQH
jgi:outer membrane protein TolC